MCECVNVCVFVFHKYVDRIPGNGMREGIPVLRNLHYNRDRLGHTVAGQTVGASVERGVATRHFVIVLPG